MYLRREDQDEMGVEQNIPGCFRHRQRKRAAPSVVEYDGNGRTTADSPTRLAIKYRSSRLLSLYLNGATLTPFQASSGLPQSLLQATSLGLERVSMPESNACPQKGGGDSAMTQKGLPCVHFFHALYDYSEYIPARQRTGCRSLARRGGNSPTRPRSGHPDLRTSYIVTR